MSTRDFYKIALVSASGKGKTYSFRNLDPETTGFINVENKPLPFPNKFKNFINCTKYDQARQALVDFGKDDKITTVIFDSFSAYVDMLLLEARKKYRGFDIWNFYNDEIGKILALIKWCPKEVFVTAHPEILGIEGEQEKRIKVKGKEWEGVIEKEFTIVLYANNKLNDKGKPEYFFNLFEDGTSSKCPPMIFGEEETRIPNDAQLVLEHVVKFATI